MSQGMIDKKAETVYSALIKISANTFVCVGAYGNTPMLVQPKKGVLPYAPTASTIDGWPKQ